MDEHQQFILLAGQHGGISSLHPRGGGTAQMPGEQSRYIRESFYFSSRSPSTRALRLCHLPGTELSRDRCSQVRGCNLARRPSMKIRTLILGTLVSTGALAAFAAPASAYIVCNDFGDCWHAESRYERPGIRFQYHPDDWYFHRTWSDRDRWRWRSEYHRDRGYWRNGIWITF